MSFRRVTKLLCGLAGGSALLAAMAESIGYLDKSKPGENTRVCTAALGALQAAQPWLSPAHNDTVTPSGDGWDSNWDK